VQNWSCHTCGQCCKEYVVFITDEERKKIIAQGWEKRPEFSNLTPVVRDGWFGRYRLNHRADGSCVFLDENGRCRIHAQFGEPEKPLACQVYPYVLVPTGDHWRVGVRYACPSATANKGRAVSLQKVEITRYAHELEEREGVQGRSLAPPRLKAWQRLSWDDVDRLVKSLSRIIADEQHSLEFRLRWVLALVAMCRSAKFDKINGSRLSEFLDVLSQGLMADLPTDPATVPSPSSLGRVLFRISAAIYARRDTGAKRGTVQQSRVGLLRAGLRFARGTGPIPRVHGLLPHVTFEQLETNDGQLPAESNELLTRYYRVKLESYQFFGSIHFGYRFWDGVEALALTFPVIMYLSRAFQDVNRAKAIETALQIVDDNFGYNALLGTRRQKWVVRALAARSDLPKLIARYSR